MTNHLDIAPSVHDRLFEHLFKDGMEQVAFVFAEATATGDGVLFSAQDAYLVQADEFAFQSEYHVSLNDDCLGRVIKQAWDRKASLVDLHSHISGLHPTRFSPSDLCGLSDFVPHVWWRLKHKPIAALVVSPSSFDALVWTSSPDDPEGLASLRVGGGEIFPTGLTLRMSEARRGW